MENRLEKYQGIFPAFYACYDAQGNISEQGVQDLTRYFIRHQADGIYVNGSSGECIYLTVAERKKILENVMKAGRGKLAVIAHVACNSTKESMELARHAQALGVDAIAAIPPIYFRLPEHAVAGYWNAISSAAPYTDMILYNIPQLAGTALSPALYQTMCENPKVIGVKNSSMPVQDIQIFRTIGKDQRLVFNGPDEQFIAGRLMGAVGGIGGTYGAMPDLFRRMDQAFKEGDLDLALEMQDALNEIISILCSGKGSMYALIKEVLRINEGLDLGGVRPPLPSLEASDFALASKAARRITEARRIYL